MPKSQLMEALVTMSLEAYILSYPCHSHTLWLCTKDNRVTSKMKRWTQNSFWSWTVNWNQKFSESVYKCTDSDQFFHSVI